MHSRLKGNEVFLLARMLAPELGKKESYRPLYR